MIFGLYTEFNHTDAIVKYKITSYQEVKDAGLWIKQNSNKNDIIITASTMQITYYSERKISDFYPDPSDKNETGFDNKIKQLKPRYIVIDAFQPVFTPKWAYDWPQRHSNSVVPVQAYFADPEKKQPLLIIYEFKNYEL